MGEIFLAQTVSSDEIKMCGRKQVHSAESHALVDTGPTFNAGVAHGDAAGLKIRHLLWVQFPTPVPIGNHMDIVGRFKWRSCGRKKRHAERPQQNGMRAYGCAFCGGWHLTTDRAVGRYARIK